VRTQLSSLTSNQGFNSSRTRACRATSATFGTGDSAGRDDEAERHQRPRAQRDRL
jgi:hypothetical protein